MKGKKFEKSLTVGLIRTALMFFNSFVAMLCLGAAHSHDPRVPAFGYWTTFWLAFAFYAIATIAAEAAS